MLERNLFNSNDSDWEVIYRVSIRWSNMDVESEVLF